MNVLNRPVLEFTLLILFAVYGECQFYSINTFGGLNIRTCLPWSCSHTCSQKENEDIFAHRFVLEKCHCDRLCPVFGDCCWNYFKDCQSLKTISDVFKHIGSTPEEMSRRDFSTAIKLKKYGRCTFVKNREGHLSSGFYSVSKCPEDYQDVLVRNKCENNTLAIPLDSPVANKWNLKEVYSNVFCAMCHNLDVRNIIFWNSTILCSFNNEQTNLEAIKIKYSQELCFTTVATKTKFQLRYCNDLYVNKCTMNADRKLPENITLSLNEVKTLCSSYLAPILMENGRLANPHCSLCSFNNTTFELADCFVGTSTRVFSWMTKPSEYLIDVSPAYSSLTITNSNGEVDIPSVICNVKERYNQLLQRCDSISCPDPSTVLLPNSSCGSVHKYSLLLPLRKHLTITIQLKTIFQNENNYIADRILNTFNKTVEEYADQQIKANLMFLSQELERPFVTESNLAVSPADTWTYSLRFSITSNLSFSDTLSLLDVFYRHIVSYEETNISIPYTISRMSAINYKEDEDFNCVNGTTITLTNTSLFTVNGTILAYDTHAVMYYDLEFVPSVFLWPNTLSDMEIQSVIVCRNIFPDCETFKLYNDFKENDDGQLNILSREHGLEIKVGNFLVRNETAYICTHDFIKEWKLKNSKLLTEELIHQLYHIISSCITVVCLSLLLGIILAYKQYRTRFQQLILVLTCMLILTYSLELCAVLEMSSAKITMAAILHFVWLESFFVSGLIAVDLIQEARKDDTGSDHGRFLLAEVFISLALSTAIFVPCIVLDIDYIDHLQIGYGEGDKIWWIKSPLPLVIFFGIPIVLTVLFNMIVMAYLINKLRTCSVIKRWCVNARHQYPLFIKINLIMLLTSVISITSEIRSDDDLSIVAYTLAAFIGVFFLCSYGEQCIFRYAERKEYVYNEHLQHISSVSSQIQSHTHSIE